MSPLRVRRSSRLHPQVGVADADDVARCCSSRALVTRAPFTNVPFVEPGVLDPEPVGRGCRASRAGSETIVVAVEADARSRPRARRGRCRDSSIAVPGCERRAGQHETAPASAARPRARSCAASAAARMMLSCGAAAEVPRGRLGRRARRRGRAGRGTPILSASSVSSVVTASRSRERAAEDDSVPPIVMRSPSSSGVALVTRRPLSSVPFVEPRSTTVQPSWGRPARSRSAGATRSRRRPGRRTRASARGRRVRRDGMTRSPIVSVTISRAAAGALPRARARARAGRVRPVDDRRRGHFDETARRQPARQRVPTHRHPASRRSGRRAASLPGLDDARGDAELADREIVVGRDQHARAG